ncbi:hypothetical protein AVEN_23405-1 [Araneus ventricosus]|uniref:Reverse transcriptase RNase H-like domain-containing protein n=1 Tax=Araneus ventricosus TaxID=182803 RepID=A0A4Y2E985_ARAVE|nr:hypothetical protein AVEN_23405-1 [Araneus ventricosus]
MLLQLGSDDKWHFVYCVSKKTTETENKCHSSKLELMAIVCTLERLLLDISFTEVTDCQALIYMNAKKSSNPKVARWSLLFKNSVLKFVIDLVLECHISMQLEELQF